MKKKIGNQIFKYLFIICFIIFLTIYISQATGYYEYSQYKKKELTEEEIKKFEQDIKDGKEIDIESYIPKEKNYQNKISQAGLLVSEKIGEYTVKGITFIFGSIGKLIE